MSHPAHYAGVLAPILLSGMVACHGAAGADKPALGADSALIRVQNASNIQGQKELLSESEIRDVTAQVVAIRGLAPKVPIVTRMVDEEGFRAALRKHRDAVASTPVGRELPPEAANADLSNLYLAFYDEVEKVVFLRATMPSWASAGIDARALFAHEVTHALQDQHFNLDALHTQTNRDRLMAYKALIEGDAEIVKAAFEARAKGRGVRRAAGEDLELGGLGPEALVSFGMFSPSLLKMPPAGQQFVIFPYISGRNFASAVYRAGGFALLNRVYGTVPASTEHILHPDRYFCGVQPVTFPVTDVPVGYTRKNNAVIGELGMRSALAKGFSREGAVELASHWAGDNTLVLTATAASLLWITAWRDEESAIKFENESAKEGRDFDAALEKLLPSNPAGPSSEAGRTRPTIVVQRAGLRVALASGIPRADAEREVRKLLALQATEQPTAAPFGDVVIPPPALPVEQRAPFHATMNGTTLDASAFGVTATVPAGLQANLITPKITALFANPHYVVAFQVQTVDANEKNVTVVHGAALQGFLQTSTDKKSNLVRSGPVVTALGIGTERVDEIPSKRMMVQSIIVPACQNNAIYTFVTMWRDAESEPAVHDLVRQFKSRGDLDKSAFCTTLQRELHEP